MSRFTDINLALLPNPQSIQILDYDSIVAAAIADLTQRLNNAGIAYDVGNLETDPLKINEEHRAYFELLLRARVNEAIRAVLLATSTGADLENVCADLDIVRRVVTPATGNTPAVMETDEVLRARRQLAPEGFSCAGPVGAYYFFSLEAHPFVKDVGVYGPESGLVDPGQVKVSVLSNQGNGAASDQVVASVAAKLNAREIRPLTDQVIVESATIVDYQINLVITLPPGPDPTYPAAIQAQATARLTTLAAALNAVGQGVPLVILYAAAAIPDATGVSPALNIAPAFPGISGDIVADIPDTPRTAFNCTAITVTTDVVAP
jgi:phage-related baseplate assembly protein